MKKNYFIGNSFNYGNYTFFTECICAKRPCMEYKSEQPQLAVQNKRKSIHRHQPATIRNST